MRMVCENDWAGAAPTATGPEDAKAETPAIEHSPNPTTAPEVVQPAGDSFDGAEILDRVHADLSRFVRYPSPHAAIAHVLWIAHAHLMDGWFTTPRLAVLSPEPASGKSRVMEMTALLVPNPVLSVNSSPAYILRKVANQENRPTILYDEIDTIFGPAARGNEDLRGMINAGYRRGMTTGRCVSDKGEVLTVELDTYAAVAMSGLGDVPDTIMSRSVIIRMRKRAVGECVEPFRPQINGPEADLLRTELADWAASVAALAGGDEPALPDVIEDRNADVWAPLITVADLADGDWPDAARSAAIDAVSSAKAGKRPSLGVQLLSDIRARFGLKDRMTTADLVASLLADDEAPWGDLKGRPLDARKMAGMLREYGIASSTIRLPSGSTPKGYKREAFEDAWKRYLPPVSAPVATSATKSDDVADVAAAIPAGARENT